MGYQGFGTLGGGGLVRGALLWFCLFGFTASGSLVTMLLLAVAAAQNSGMLMALL